MKIVEAGSPGTHSCQDILTPDILIENRFDLIYAKFTAISLWIIFYWIVFKMFSFAPFLTRTLAINECKTP